MLGSLHIQAWHKDVYLMSILFPNAKSSSFCSEGQPKYLPADSLDEYIQPTSKLPAHKNDTEERGGETQPLCLLSRSKRAIKEAVIKLKTQPDRASHQVAFLYPVPRKILAGTKNKQTALPFK